MRHALPPRTETGSDLDLSYFVEWHQRLWTPAVRFLLGDPTRFAGRRVLDIGCRHGRMSCLFGLLGATVVGVDLDGVPLGNARSEARRWGVQERVSFGSYNGAAANLPGGDYDFVFTKSVLVVVPELELFLRGLTSKLRAGGELLAVENMAGGRLLRLVRRLRKYDLEGVDAGFLTTAGRVFTIAEVKTYYASVAAIRARNDLT